MKELSHDLEELLKSQTMARNRIHAPLVAAGFKANQVATDLFGSTGKIIQEGPMRGWKPIKTS